MIPLKYHRGILAAMKCAQSVFQTDIKLFLTGIDRFTVFVMLIRLRMRATHTESQNTSWSNPLRHKSRETYPDLYFSSLFFSFRCSVT